MKEKASQDGEVRPQLEALYKELLSLKEAVVLAESEGTDIKKAKVRIERAEKLYKDAAHALDKKSYAKSKAKMKAMQSMLESARQNLTTG